VTREETISESTISHFLEQLASRDPAPGGGAASALQLALGAALVGMVARCTQGPKYAQHEALVTRIISQADTLRAEALKLAAADATAFTAVASAHKLPRDTREQRAHRTATIARALLAAAEPPAAVIATAEHVLTLAEQLLPAANPNARPDLSAATQSTRSAVTTAHLNLETNLAGAGGPAPAHLTAPLARREEVITRADQVTATIIREITGPTGKV
jgi:formiminotetrahydrofolate cyclodeaminase